MFLRGDYWHYDFIVNGERFRGTTGYLVNEKAKAKAFVEAKKVEAREKKSLLLSWEQTKRKLSENNKLSLDTESIWKEFAPLCNAGEVRKKIYKIYLNRWCEWMKLNYPDVLYIGNVTDKHSVEWFSFVRSEDGANATKNSYIKVMRLVFSTLGKRAGIIENPFYSDGIKLLPAEAANRDAFTPEELSLIGKNAKGWMYSLLITGISTGLREGDICKLKRKDVNLESGWIYLVTGKTSACVDIPIMPGLKRHLEECLSKPIPEELKEYSEYVFPELAKKYFTCSNSIGREVKIFFEKIGITGTKKEVNGYKRLVSVKDVHSLRHTFVYLAAVHGIPFPIVQSIVGHASPEMTKHYMDHARREEKSLFFRRIPEYLTDGNTIKALPQKKEITRERVKRILNILNAKNIEKTKIRLLKLL